MTMWDDLMNTFNFPPDYHIQTSGRAVNESVKVDARSSSNSSPCTPCLLSSSSTSTASRYIFPAPIMPSPAVFNKRAPIDLANHSSSDQRQLARSISSRDLKQEFPLDQLVSSPQVMSDMRPRVYTWASTMSDSPHLATLTTSISATSQAGGPSDGVAYDDDLVGESQGNHQDRSIGPNKRRATCPDSMRNYHRNGGRVGLTSRTAGATVTVDGAASSKLQMQQCPKIEDVDSDISDEDNNYTAGHREFHSSGDASSASDISYESHLGKTELTIIRQPESHHRARYQKEGSRGCIKDRTGNSCPAVQLRHYSGGPLTLQAFIGTESGPVRPHPLYRVCKVGGKHSTPCREALLDNGITALEMDLTRENSFTLNVDCLGILKLRNADFEQVFDAEDLAKRRKRSPKVRLVFRVVLALAEGRTATLQAISTPICCTPSPGVPEIHFLSHPSCSVSGGIDIVVIGRNFVKDDSKLFVVERNQDDGVVWEREVVLLQENFNQVHLVGTLPAFRDLLILQPVDVSLHVRNKGGKQSEPHKFTYLPDDSAVQRLAFSHGALTAASPGARRNIPKPADVLSTNAAANGLPIIQIPQQYGQSVGSGNGQNLQYCLQLPGTLQPIIITIPQNGPSSSVTPTVTSSSSLSDTNGMVSFAPSFSSDNLAQSSSPSYDHGQRNLSQESFTGMVMNGFIGHDDATPSTLSACSSSKSLLLREQEHASTSSPGVTSDEDLFNELLKEILGTGDQECREGGGGSGAGPLANVYNSPVHSPASVAALAAARSFRAMDINAPFHNGASDFIPEEERDDFMA